MISKYVSVRVYDMIVCMEIMKYDIYSDVCPSQEITQDYTVEIANNHLNS